MSPDLIKRGEFRDLYEAADVPAVPGEGTGAAGRPRRFDSHRARFRELLDRLAEAEDRERRVVAEATARARAEALAEAERRYGEAEAALRAVGGELGSAVRERTDVAVDEILEIALAVASKIVRREVRRDEAFVERMVRRCLQRILQRSSVRVRLHPEDHARIAARVDEIAAESGLHHELVAVADRRVDRGGCVVETPDFVVDGTIRSQLETARGALAGDGA